MGMDANATAVGGNGSWRRFWLHYVEMVLAMVVGMAVFGGVVSLALALSGNSFSDLGAGLRALVMTVDMTLGMSLWMRFRHHSSRAIAEMAASMVVPYLVLIGPYLAGALTAGMLLLVMHRLMLPCMAAVMLYRREEYMRGHHHHMATAGEHAHHH